MDSYHLRLLITGLFIAFLIVVIVSDLIRRRPGKRLRSADEGFRSMKPPRPGMTPGRDWKAGPRR